ncbi:putative mitochondrial carrier protein; 51683-53289 [Arabidopsis thaliana]|uniref:Probable mitochondrial adenine nucleotide transporter BTL2 n=3 Tax=Arabidopsis TaxID=3701 RepID=BRTL2_ARATH|nr:Mitochondrial substrate carrier family protein [Arabidopsis thaliana]Q9C9R4.1 RecName: Full=Probable mitochondrial adenine nucleotide transporter BTL2; AltName: Full=Adenine nucleotide transporter BT1-like protein 2 [Arabidopsis thaliana]KAG7659988.1 Mitochondrial substrate/solute carrier [Arabidopsis suecica]AAG52097.1 putative mitochondrial carrier protein; 51683-53289 [Arabidopsis thaliana]AEE36078.1 Mitochondrial substrate carrier family protein [Arabidopsis thaliana]CAA0340890.1 unname|eukprot:NP_565171.4 Mitochondrial substrate carrier family protein [Arabidopsis thaliana]
MSGLDIYPHDPSSSSSTSSIDLSNEAFFSTGGLFLEPPGVSSSFFDSISSKCSDSEPLHFPGYWRNKTRLRSGKNFMFLSVSLSKDRSEQQCKKALAQNDEIPGKDNRKRSVIGGVRRRGTMNTRKHLWAGAVAAMVSKTFLAPLERLKLEYTVRGEQRNLLVVAKSIATTQGLTGFWKGNLLNVLRTAPFKAVNFCAYDTYRKQLLKIAGNQEATNFERFVAGAAAGITATVLCLPLDTIRTKLVARGGEALGGIGGAFRYMIQTEGLFSLYKGLVPSIASMALSGAVFYGVYDILKSSFLHTPEGRKRLIDMKQQGQELNALDRLELGPIRTLMYGAIAGACTEVATYPFEVVRRQLQMQMGKNKLNALAMGFNIIERGGIPALYAGLLPSLLQVLPSASISYFVYECMKIVLKVE